MVAIRVVVADDHPVVREGTIAILTKTPDIVVVGQATNGIQVLEIVNTLLPDILLLDMEMPGLTGLEVAQQLRKDNSKVRVLALSAYNDEEYIRGILASGAAGYLVKDEAPDVILDAIRGIFRGEEGWFSRRVTAHLLKQAEKPRLSGREIEVLRLITLGKTNGEIGATLSISEKTVEKHIGEIFTKLDVHSRVEAAVYAIREGIVTGNPPRKPNEG
jgi:DNA-binding NarL/FixJ family response regulator